VRIIAGLMMFAGQLVFLWNLYKTGQKVGFKIAEAPEHPFETPAPATAPLPAPQTV
jgi:hypothetical protein